MTPAHADIQSERRKVKKIEEERRTERHGNFLFSLKFSIKIFAVENHSPLNSAFPSYYRLSHATRFSLSYYLRYSREFTVPSFIPLRVLRAGGYAVLCGLLSDMIRAFVVTRSWTTSPANVRSPPFLFFLSFFLSLFPFFFYTAENQYLAAEN